MHGLGRRADGAEVVCSSYVFLAEFVERFLIVALRRRSYSHARFQHLERPRYVR